MFQNCPCIQIKDIPVSVTMSQIKRTQVGSIYNNRKNICVHTISISKARIVVNFIVDLKGLDTRVRLGEVETDSIVVELEQS